MYYPFFIMITQIQLTIDKCEVYAILDDEISSCMDLPYYDEFPNNMPDKLGTQLGGIHDEIKRKFNNEGNFYKYLIGILLK